MSSLSSFLPGGASSQSLRGAMAALLLGSASWALAAEASSLTKLDYSGDQSAIQAIDHDIAEAGRDLPKVRAVVEQLLGDLKQPNLTFAARQAICERLGRVLALAPTEIPAASALTPLRKMLVSERDVNVARLALEPVPGPAVDELFLQALRRSDGRIRIAIVQSIGARRIATAVTDLKPLLGDPDTDLATSVACALGSIGTPESLAALRAAPNPASPPVVAAVLAILPRLPGPEAVAMADALGRDQRLSPALRAAAVRAAIEADTGGAAQRIVAVLDGKLWTDKETAIEAIASSTAPGLVAAITAKLPTWDAATQVAVIAALGRKADGAASAPIVAALRHESPDVRLAAVTALGLLPGTPAVVQALIPVASGDEMALAKPARIALARLNGPEVDATILDGARRAAAPGRTAYLEQIALRNLAAGLPLLHEARNDPDATIRSAAVNALGEIGPASEQAFLIDWAIHAADATEQTRALRALVLVTQRNPDAANRSTPIIQAIEQAEPSVAAKMIPILPRLEDRASAEAAARLALRDDAAVANAATATLARWSDVDVLPVLATVAEKAPSESNRKAAFLAAYRVIDRNRGAWTEDLTAVTKRLCQASPDVKSRQQAVRMLAHARDNDATAFAEGLATNAEVGADARYAAECIQANLAGPLGFRASGSTNQLKNLADGKTSTRWSVPAEAGQWLEIDFKRTRPLARLTLDQTGRTSDFPPEFQVYVTDDAQHPGSALLTSPGRAGQTVIQLPPNTRGRYVIIKLTGDRADSSWTVCELTVD